MKPIRLKEAATWMQATFSGEDAVLSGVAIDSRALVENELFFALVGERVNGHDFIEQAKQRKASGIVVSQPVHSALPTLRVKDTGLALADLAREYRKQFNIPMAAVTGSYGKTTVKEMLANILSVEGETLKTQGNLNTEIGVPLTLFKLKPEHRFAVIEMGARKKQDIQYLMSIANPTVALVNNAGIAHIEIFGSEQGVRNAKGELYSELRPDGTAVICLDDPHVAYWKSLLRGQRIVTFGKAPAADVSIDNLELYAEGARFHLKYQGTAVPITLRASGLHNIHNALAAASVALALGLSIESVQKGLEEFTPVTGRLQFKKGVNGSVIIDDTYNANPASMRAALEVLSTQPGEKWFVMGDMLELGEHAAKWHGDIGDYAKQLGIHNMCAVGTFTKNAITAFGKAATHYESKADLIQVLQKNLAPNTTVLVKGSRGMRMEEIVFSLEDSNNSDNQGANHAC